MAGLSKHRPSNLVQLYGFVPTDHRFRTDKDGRAHCGMWFRVHLKEKDNNRAKDNFQVWIKGYGPMAEWLNLNPCLHRWMWITGRLRCAKFRAPKSVVRGIAFYFIEVTHVRVDHLQHIDKETVVVTKSEWNRVRAMANKAKEHRFDVNPQIASEIAREFEVDPSTLDSYDSQP